jgi:hypothetical protein
MPADIEASVLSWRTEPLGVKKKNITNLC